MSSGSPTRKIGSGSSSGISRLQCLQPDTGCVCTVPHAGHIHGSFIIRRLLHRLLPATTNSCRGGHRRSRSAITGAARQAFVQGSCVSGLPRSASLPGDRHCGTCRCASSPRESSPPARGLSGTARESLPPRPHSKAMHCRRSGGQGESSRAGGRCGSRS